MAPHGLNPGGAAKKSKKTMKKTCKTKTVPTVLLLGLLGGAALLSLASCEKQETQTTGTIPVNARADVLAPVTKAGSHYIPNTQTAWLPAGSDFSLWAWTGTGTAGEPDFMKDTQVHNDGGAAEGSFSYTPLKYWPTDNAPVTFCASWPYGLQGLQTLATAQGVRYAYTVPGTAAQQEDLLVSTPVTASLSDGGTVTLPFRHALTKVKVVTAVDATFQQNGTLAEIDAVALLGAASGGTLDPATYTWTPGAGTQDYACTTGNGDADLLLLLPQDTQGLRFRLDYTVHILDTQGNSVSHTSHTSFAALPEGLTWGPGEAYEYRLTLRESHLEVSVSVLPWELQENSYDYSTEITVNSDERLQWLSGTYSSTDPSTFTLITAFGRDVEGTFTISTPEGAVWYAILETLTGEPDAFLFDDGEGNLSASAHGSVGQQAHLKIHQKEDYPAQTNSARLSVVVRSAGHNIPVETLVDNQGHNWTIVQNANH